MRKCGRMAAIIAIGAVLSGAVTLRFTGSDAQAANPKKDKEGQDWAHYGADTDETHFSPLAQVNAQTVSKLGLAWYYDIDAYDTFTAPLAVNGVIYFAVGLNLVHAVDARTGKLLWKYDPEVYKSPGAHKMRAGWGPRGIAYADGKLFTGTRDGRLIAVDAETGKPVWSQQTLPVEDDSYITGAPWIAGDKVVMGFGGGDYGPVRGYVTAYDIKTGKQAWRFYTVPGQPGVDKDWTTEFAAKSWTGEWWKYGGGGNVWNAMAYDKKYNHIYLGTGNGFPWNQKIRSPGGGDNLFLSSIVALDADTGRYVWHHQTTPANSWDFNNAMDIQLARLPIDGQPHDVIIHAPKDGFFYVIDRATGKLLSAEKFAKINWASHVDMKTGRPVENPAARYTDGPFLMYPTMYGSHGVATMSFNPQTGLVYIPVMDGGRPVADPPNVKDWTMRLGGFVNSGIGPAPGMKYDPATSSLLAWDPVKAKPVWSIPQNGQFNGGTITTAGNLVFQGVNTGQFVAWDARDGKKLWAFEAQNGILGNAITYMIGGTQYVTVLTGFRNSAATQPLWDYREQKRRVLTFMLGGKAKLPPFTKLDQPIVDDPDFVLDSGRADKGGATFNRSCSLCHGGGVVAGGAAPDLRRSGIPLDGEAFASVVRDGALMERGMPSYTQLSDDELLNIRHYIRQRARATPDRVVQQGGH